MSATIVTAATMDAAARRTPVLPPANGTARNMTPDTMAKTPLVILTKLERSSISETPYTMVRTPATVTIYNAASLPASVTSPPLASNMTADTTKSSADTIATPLKILLSSAPMLRVRMMAHLTVVAESG